MADNEVMVFTIKLMEEREKIHEKLLCDNKDYRKLVALERVIKAYKVLPK